MNSEQLFFYENAGWGYNPATETPDQGRRLCAVQLELAERIARNLGYGFEWSIDTDTDSSNFSDDPEPWALWVCDMTDSESVTVQSLGGVDFGRDGLPSDNDYARVVQAELALEELG